MGGLGFCFKLLFFFVMRADLENKKTTRGSHHILEEPQRLEKYRRGLVSSELLSETEIIFLLETKGQQPASSFKAACGQGGRTARGARAAGSKGRRRQLSHLQQVADQRRAGAELQQRLLSGRCTWHSASSRTCAKIRQRRQHQGHRRMKLQDNVNVRAVVVKEVQLRDPVTRSLRVRCAVAPAPAPAPVALPSTAHCPASGDPPPTSTRPPPTRTAIRAAAARRPTDYGARARRPQRGQHQQGLRSERRATRRPQTMGPGPGLVAHVLWRYCMRLASSGVGGVRRLRLAFGRHPMPDAPPPHT